jgi:1-acyl-sn-glycerol-3-phosphate acyltransferase
MTAATVAGVADAGLERDNATHQCRDVSREALWSAVRPRTAFATQPWSTPKAFGALRVAALTMWRVFALVLFSTCALAEIMLITLVVRREQHLATRAAWLHRWCRFACRVLGVCVVTHGSMPRSGLVVCNHLSYLDIIVLSSVTPCVFVAKRDVVAWPLFGWLARAAGTIFADRRRKLDAAIVVAVMGKAIAAGSLVVLFPEGTSSDGSSVLPFKSTLLEPAVQLSCAVTAAAIDYSLPRGSVADEVCYWRDMILFPHLLNLFTKETIESKLVVAPFKPVGTNRKEIAGELRRQIIQMRS